MAEDREAIEAIEYKDKIIGVQFHPELNQEYMSLFHFLTAENKARDIDDSIVTFRLASVEDVGRICEIYDAIHTEEEAGKSSTGWVRDIYPTINTVWAALEREDIFVGETEGKIVGSFILNHSQVECYSQGKWKNKCRIIKFILYILVHTLVIGPALSGKDYGRAFIKFYEESAISNHCTELRLDTQAKNIRARVLYQRNGYKEIGIVPCVFNGIPDVQLVLLEKTLF